jgi:hypothetical protein
MARFFQKHLFAAACLVAIASDPAFAFYEHTDAECRRLGDLASEVVGARERGLTYAAALAMVDPTGTARTADQRRTAQEAAYVVKLVYRDMPRLSSEGAYKVVALSCVADSDNVRRRR